MGGRESFPRFVVGMASRKDAPQHMNRDGFVDTRHLVLVKGCCCSNAFLYCGDDCVGCAGKQTCPCIEPTVCVKGIRPDCCFVTSWALPCDEEVPRTLAFHGLACYPKWGCCETFAELNGAPVQTITKTTSVSVPLLGQGKEGEEGDKGEEVE